MSIASTFHLAAQNGALTNCRLVLAKHITWRSVALSLYLKANPSNLNQSTM
jgi:hypothetical protein